MQNKTSVSAALRFFKVDLDLLLQQQNTKDTPKGEFQQCWLDCVVHPVWSFYDMNPNMHILPKTPGFNIGLLVKIHSIM